MCRISGHPTPDSLAPLSPPACGVSGWLRSEDGPCFGSSWNPARAGPGTTVYAMHQ
jgi:hypothetical protein